MRIPKEERKKYNKSKERGDIKNLMNLTGLSRGTIYNILKNGDCDPSIAMKFREFFAPKIELLKELETVKS